MTLVHAVVWTDRQPAQVLQFDAKHVVGHEVVDHPCENQLVALARKISLKHDNVAGAPVP